MSLRAFELSFHHQDIDEEFFSIWQAELPDEFDEAAWKKLTMDLYEEANARSSEILEFIYTMLERKGFKMLHTAGRSVIDENELQS